MAVIYRSASEKDLIGILNILDIVSGDIEDINVGQFLIAEDKNKIIGCARIKKINGCYKLASLAVMPNCRRMGIGSSLVEEILNRNAERPVYLFCNTKNENFYKKFGFNKIEAGNMPDVLKKDYGKLRDSKFAGNTKLLTVMVSLQSIDRLCL